MMLTEQHQVLMADMTWKAAQDLQVGDLLSVPWLVGAVCGDGTIVEAPSRFPVGNGHIRLSPEGMVIKILQVVDRRMPLRRDHL